MSRSWVLCYWLRWLICQTGFCTFSSCIQYPPTELLNSLLVSNNLNLISYDLCYFLLFFWLIFTFTWEHLLFLNFFEEMLNWIHNVLKCHLIDFCWGFRGFQWIANLPPRVHINAESFKNNEFLQSKTICWVGNCMLHNMKEQKLHQYSI